MEHTIQYGTQTIRFTIIKSDRKTFGVTVYPDKRVLVLAPENRTDEEIIKRFRHRLPWVIRHLDYFEKIIIPSREKRYVSGETHYYLGKQYRLKAVSSIIDKVNIRKGYITVYAKNKSDIEKTKKFLMEWYKSRSIIVFSNLVKEFLPKFKKYGITDFPKISLRTMQTKWGSCSKKGTITLNNRLIMNSLPLIRYVVLHELCHLVFYNHTKEYYKLLSNLMPEWRLKKHLLDYSEF